MFEPEHREEADALSEALERELREKRLNWERERDKYRLIRLLGFSFLSLVILGSLIAFYFVLSRVNEARDQRPATSPAASPTVPGEKR